MADYLNPIMATTLEQIKLEKLSKLNIYRRLFLWT